jgi:copper chaperone CopZ
MIVVFSTEPSINIEMNTQILIENLKCNGCASTITKTVNTFKGVNGVSVNVEDEIISIEHDENLDLNDLKHKLKSIGYPERDTIHGIDKAFTNAKSYVSCAIGRISN